MASLIDYVYNLAGSVWGPSGIAKPDKTRCAVCDQPESEDVSLQRCGRCRTVPYCSKECQKSDWSAHKLVCNQHAKDKLMQSNSVKLGEKGPKVKKGEAKRTRLDILRDLQQYAHVHNGECLTHAAWFAMGLLRNMDRAKTHFLAVTVRRTSSSDPRTLYSLVDAEVVPLSVLQEKFENTEDDSGMRMDPMAILEQNAQERLRAGGLGAVMVMTVELLPGDDSSPTQAIKDTNVPLFQPLGLFKVHRDSLRRFPAKIMSSQWKQCLKNALDGGAFSMRFRPYSGLGSK